MAPESNNIKKCVVSLADAHEKQTTATKYLTYCEIITHLPQGPTILLETLHNS